MTTILNRRTLLKAASASLALRLVPGMAQQRVSIADMHSHLGSLSRASLADSMRSQGISLVAWALPSDLGWLRETGTGLEQKSEPAPGEAAAAFTRRLGAENAYLARTRLTKVLSRADVDRCIAGGGPGVVLAAEGADFLEGKLDGLLAVFDQGLRHLQLVHYMKSLVGDRQTAEPTIGGLSPFGKQLVEACNDNGLLVDLAHCAESAVDDALAISKVPMIWSHGWVGESGGRWQDTFGYQRRRLSLARAKAIADRGGVVGFWGFGLRRPGAGAQGFPVGRDDPRGYARELARLVDLIGADHLGIGTDLAGVGKSASVNSYADVRNVVDALQARKLPDSVIERVSGGNYARVLKEALKA